MIFFLLVIIMHIKCCLFCFLFTCLAFWRFVLFMLYILFTRIKNIWMKVACSTFLCFLCFLCFLFFLRFLFFLCLWNLFVKKVWNYPNNLIYYTTSLVVGDLNWWWETPFSMKLFKNSLHAEQNLKEAIKHFQ